MASTPFVRRATPQGAEYRRETHGAGFGLLVAALLPACIVAELAAPARRAVRSQLRRRKKASSLTPSPN